MTLMLARLSMLGLLIATTPIGQPTAGPWMQWGLAGVVVAYVLYRDWDREKRMGRTIQANEQWVRDTLLTALDRNTRALEQLANRPCLAWKDRSTGSRRGGE